MRDRKRATKQGQKTSGIQHEMAFYWRYRSLFLSFSTLPFLFCFPQILSRFKSALGYFLMFVFSLFKTHEYSFFFNAKSGSLLRVHESVYQFILTHWPAYPSQKHSLPVSNSSFLLLLSSYLYELTQERRLRNLRTHNPRRFCLICYCKQRIHYLWTQRRTGLASHF